MTPLLSPTHRLGGLGKNGENGWKRSGLATGWNFRIFG